MIPHRQAYVLRVFVEVAETIMEKKAKELLDHFDSVKKVLFEKIYSSYSEFEGHYDFRHLIDRVEKPGFIVYSLSCMAYKKA